MEDFWGYINFRLILTIVPMLLTAYMGWYFVLGLERKKRKEKTDVRLGHYAIMICARNEQNVIAELIHSLQKQQYPLDHIHIFVVADNCSDETAKVARQAGATVYERENHAYVGKGYALDFLYHEIVFHYGVDAFDGFIIFDADNIVHPGFMKAINQTFMQGGYDAVTSYRNSKNYATNWLSSGYSISFLMEGRFLNGPRMYAKTSCQIGGTGYLVSNQLMKENNGWPYHLLTEDIEFSVNCVLHDKVIGYCDDAIVYDEQPVKFSTAWRQRMRWSKGFLEVNRKYDGALIRGIFSSHRHFACYDMLVIVAPSMLLLVGLIWSILVGVYGILKAGTFDAWIVSQQSLKDALTMAVGSYFSLTALGAVIVGWEWKRIRATSAEKILSIFTFPFVQMISVPATIAAAVTNVTWTPIAHHSVEQLESVSEKDSDKVKETV